MSNMIEPVLESNEIQITSLHRLSFDQRSKVIKTRYQKREGRGVGSELSNEYAYGSEKYYGSWESLSNRLMELEFQERLSTEDISNVTELIEAIGKYTETIKQVGKEVAITLSDKVVIDLGKGKKEADE